MTDSGVDHPATEFTEYTEGMKAESLSLAAFSTGGTSTRGGPL